MAARATWTDEEVLILITAQLLIESARRGQSGYERLAPLDKPWTFACPLLLGATEEGPPRRLALARARVKRLVLRIYTTKIDWDAAAGLRRKA